MMERVHAEQALIDEERVLRQVAGLLERGDDLAGWPEDQRTALVLALTDAAMSPTEGWKAVTLRRHLFGPSDVVPANFVMEREPSTLDRRRAERLRAGIPTLVRYRAGRYLLTACGRAAPTR